jgi:hypothetical protein
MINFEQIKTDEQSLKNYTNLLNLVFGKDSFNLDYLRWLYKENPYGEAFGFDAYYEEKLIAHYVTIPVIYELGKIKYKGLLSLNTATHPDFQGMGLFTQLATKTYNLAQNLNFDFVIGVANKNSTHGFINKLGFKLIASLDVYLSMEIKRKYESLDSKFLSSFDLNYINWRVSKPNNGYFIFNDIIFSKTNLMFTSICFSGRYESSKLHFKKPGFIVTLGLNNKPKNLFKIRIPNIFKPSPLNLIFKTFNDDLNNISKNDIIFEAIDFDAY